MICSHAVCRTAPRDRAGRIRRKPDPLLGDARAVDVELPDEERHVDEIVIVRGGERSRRRHRGARHSRRDVPVGLRVDDDGGRVLERLALGIHEDVGAVEEKKVRLRPGDSVVERVGDIAKVTLTVFAPAGRMRHVS